MVKNILNDVIADRLLIGYSYKNCPLISYLFDEIIITMGYGAKPHKFEMRTLIFHRIP